MSPRRVLAGYCVIMAALVAANFALPSLHLVLWSAIGGLSVAAIVTGVRINRPRRRAPWFLLAGAVASFITGDLIADVLTRVLDRQGFPSVADGFYLAVYVLIAAALIGLIHIGVARRDPNGLYDAVTVTAGLGLLSYIFLIRPYVEDPALSVLEKSISIAYPLADIVVLAVGARLISTVRRSPALLLLAAGGIGLLSADVGYGLKQLNGVWETGGPVDLGWAAFYVLWGVAALHPSMRDLTEPKVHRAGEEHFGRLLLLGLALFIAPCVLYFEMRTGEVHDATVIAASSALLSGMVLLRLGRAVNVQRRTVQRERRLRRAGAALLMATDEAGVTATARTAIAELLPLGRPHRVVLAPAGDGAVSMPYTRSLAPALAEELGDFEVTLCCPLAPVEGRESGRALYIASDEVTLVGVQEAAQILATQAALALERIALGEEIGRRNSEAYFRTLVLETADVILIVGDHDQIRYASPSARALFGSDELDGTPLPMAFAKESLVEVDRRLHELRTRGVDRPGDDLRVVGADGRPALVEATFRDLRGEPTVGGIVVTLRDVTERSRLQAELYQRATFDALTGLPNREVFLGRVQEAVSSGAENGATVGVLIMELDDFKVVNDTLGHSAGDALLVAVGKRLTEALRSVDGSYGAAGTVARLGGDEFAALVRRAGTAADVERVAEKVLASFAAPFELPHGDVTATASIGVATTAEAADAQDLLRHADLAVYVAKDAGKDRWRRYESSLHSAVVERHKLRADLDRAIADGAFLLHFQPIVAIGDRRTHGFEALVRWNHPTRGMVPPAEFISVAEESGLIVPLGAWVLRNAVEAAAQWRLLHPGEDVYVSVNVSARQFRGREQGFARWVLQEIDRMGLPPASLLLEMTESLLLHDDGEVAAELAELREAGVRIAIDDFGTGFSSLSYLRRLPVDVLKLDKSFIDTIASSAEQHAVVDMIVQLAAILQLQIVAEGIETEAERDLLVTMGCHLGQGYLFSRPLSYGDASQWLLEEASGLQRGSRTAA
ncbi:EAL domain-containing protein [Dactylosporangium aurantiacum]|uniref:EAL domain-containing protein n=1 Tax=Dactylosporangium aurantiacum TaxID=35754 RepID=A0A9Q9I944_9ACTN|nr:EAL domain-containing protein [Dactylosporangium aurantiacum]MDG6103394.1 EAL domain-containing protein [Dactylosporangium aurantiacum]UWZ52094.1 EAL domain-containing protein [Dactylosporangium aurantiacum]